MSFADSLRGWLDRSRPLHAQPAEPAELPPTGGCACCAGSAGLDGKRIAEVKTISPAEAAGWGSEAVEHYLDRLGRADDLELDTIPGSPAELVALREARRVAALMPLASWPATREEGVLDQAIGAFPGSRFVRFIDASEVAPAFPERPESSTTGLGSRDMGA